MVFIKHDIYLFKIKFNKANSIVKLGTKPTIQFRKYIQDY